MNSVAGASVRGVARNGYVRAGWGALAAAALIAGAIALLLRAAPYSAVLMACLAVPAGRNALRSFWLGQRFSKGAVSEEIVGAQLESIENVRGWRVEHDLPKQGGGNIDHVVHSPTRTFVIDTKRSHWRDKDITQARRHAEWAARHFGYRRLIIPVICVERSKRQPTTVDGICVVGKEHLVAFIEDEG